MEENKEYLVECVECESEGIVDEVDLSRGCLICGNQDLIIIEEM